MKEPTHDSSQFSHSWSHQYYLPWNPSELISCQWSNKLQNSELSLIPFLLISINLISILLQLSTFFSQSPFPEICSFSLCPLELRVPHHPNHLYTQAIYILKLINGHFLHQCTLTKIRVPLDTAHRKKLLMW